MSVICVCPEPKTWFHWDTELTVLFDGWSTSDLPWYIVTCILVFVCGVVYEWLTSFRQGLELSFNQARQQEEAEGYEQVPQIGDSGVTNFTFNFQANKQLRDNLRYLITTLLYLFQLAIGYGLILIFTTYNIGLILAVLAGAGFGHFFFDRLKNKLLTTPSSHPHETVLQLGVT